MADDYFKAMQQIEQQITLPMTTLVQPPSTNQMLGLVEQLFGSTLDTKQIEIVSALRNGLFQWASQQVSIKVEKVPIEPDT
jgi:hypothetical protein